MALLQEPVPAQATAATAQDLVIGEVSHGGTVKEVTIIPEAAVTAQATNYRTIRVVNKGQAGTGTTEVAALPLDTPGTDNLVAFDEKTIPLSGTAANLAVVAGDVLAVDETITGTGLAHGGYTVKVIYGT